MGFGIIGFAFSQADICRAGLLSIFFRAAKDVFSSARGQGKK
jgi:hypothetical protein